MENAPKNTLADSVEFAENSEPRCPCVLILDTSASMEGEPIDQLNKGLQELLQHLKKDDLTAKRGEIAVVTFNSEITIEQDFVTPDGMNLPSLKADGCTRAGAGIEQGLDLIEARKKIYRANGMAYYRPIVLIITDGEPTDDVARAIQRIKDAEANKKAVVFAVGVEGANMGRLAEIVVRPPVKLNGLDFTGLFMWLSDSLKRVSASRVGDQVALPAVGWGKIE